MRLPLHFEWSKLLPVAGALVFFSGCVRTYHVAVDAINHPHKPSGASYRFNVAPTAAGADPRIQAIALAAVKTALEGRGLFEAPEGVTPDMLLEIDYGVMRPLPRSPGGPPAAVFGSRSGTLLGGWGGVEIVREIYLKLSARQYIADSLRPRGEELWDIHVSVDASEAELEPALPVLASAAIDYLGENSHIRVLVPLRSDSPDITFIKDGVNAALKQRGG